MRSYSIAILLNIPADDEGLLESVAALRQQVTLSSIYWYGQGLDDGTRLALQKLDVTIRHDDSGCRYKTVRRMFTEVDADVFVYVGHAGYPAELAPSMIHQLIETRRDMVAAVAETSYSKLNHDYRSLCAGLFGRTLTCPLSDYRVFSRRFVKSFAVFERGLPVELEWSIHALELDIPYTEIPVDPSKADALCHHHQASEARGRHLLTRIIINLQARPLKWFGLMTALFLMLASAAKMLYLFPEHLDQSIGVASMTTFTILAFSSAVSGVLFHAQSHTRRELKRLHFQQHSTL